MSTSASTADDALRVKYVTPYSKGSMKSNTGEDWSYDHGVVTCTFGPSRLAGTWSWTGSDLKNDNAMQAQGVFDGTFVHWIMPGDKKAIYSLKLTAESAESLKWSNTQIKWKSVVHWTHDLKAFSLSVDAGSGADHPEGCPVNWTVLGSFPAPVALMIAMVTRANKLQESYIEYHSRSFKRCAILIMTPIDAFLCAKCGDGDGATTCTCCKSASGGHKGAICKQCGVKGRMRCVKCNEPIGASRVPAQLCDTHGLGSRARECCKMSYHELR